MVEENEESKIGVGVIAHLRARPRLAIYVLLIVMILVAYGQVYRFDFVNYDDGEYVADNPHTLSPFSWSEVAWAFTSVYFANWHPLTLLSHKLDYQIFGMNAAGPHVENVLFHVLNTLLLFEALRRMTGSAWRSFFVAALFAIHPQHVESVAWISARKDVLSTFFVFLALLGYSAYVRRPNFTRYLFVLIPFALGVMAKSIVVTFPCMLLLLDYWPLGRLGGSARAWKVVVEKAPVFVVAVLASVIAFQIKTEQTVPALYRAGNALVAYGRYLQRTFWPFGLSVYYPHPRTALPLWQPVVAVVLLALVSVLVAVWWRRRYVTVGWLWYLGTLAPAAGFVQIGGHAMADRYAYIPLVGVFLACVWGWCELGDRLGVPRRALHAAGAVLLAALTVIATVQVHYWSDSRTLFEHALRVTPKNYLAHYNLGTLHLSKKEYPQAVEQFEAALRDDPSDVPSVENLGVALSAMGKHDEAIRCYYAALTLEPDHVKAQINLGYSLMAKGDLDTAAKWLKDALALSPHNPDALYNLGSVYYRQGKYVEALQQFQEAVQYRPDYAEVYYAAGLTLKRQQRYNEAAAAFARVLELNPDHSGARKELESLQPSR